MRRYFCFVIMFLSLESLHFGCRAKLDTNSSTSSRQAEVIGLEFRKADSLWGSSSERLTYKIEFYPLEYAYQNPATPKVLGDPAAPVSTMPATNVGGVPLSGSVGGGMGAVKSIEITKESTQEGQSVSKTDSTYYNMAASETAQQKETATEARHDNGTVAIVSVVAAVAFIVIVLIVIRRYFKK